MVGLGGLLGPVTEPLMEAICNRVHTDVPWEIYEVQNELLEEMGEDPKKEKYNKRDAGEPNRCQTIRQ